MKGKEEEEEEEKKEEIRDEAHTCMLVLIHAYVTTMKDCGSELHVQYAFSFFIIISLSSRCAKQQSR